MKIMIAGLGSIGRRHFRNLLALGERDLLLYRTHHSTLPEDELASFPVETDLQAALAQKPAAVIVSNPTSLHLDVAIPAARAGCHVMLEKPVSHTLDGVEALVSALESGGGKLLVGFHFRYHPGLRRMKELLEEGAIGRPLSARAHWGEYLPGWHPWEDYRRGYSARSDLGGGVVLTLSHPLDYLRWIFGEAQALWAFCANSSELGLQVEDMAEIGMRFASGMLGSLHLNYLQRPPAHWMEVIGSQGSLHWKASEGGLQIYQGANDAWKEIPAPQGFERNTLFLDEMRHFLQVCRNEAEPRCTLQDGIWALKLALAAHRSQACGQTIEF